VLRSLFHLAQHLWHVNASNQSMKPTAPHRNAFSVFATTPPAVAYLFLVDMAVDLSMGNRSLVRVFASFIINK